ncbi:Ubiquitin [Halocaridina rubra]|uniref:Ubiquitin n=1 Tax=Halocaridina rubra TaxID=373956 RepID=A0AAN9AAY1_HALRR
MLSYEGLQDTLTALVVIIIVSAIIAFAWLSTSVREQPLIATAVVVFQSDVNGERGGNMSTSDSNERVTHTGRVQEGQAISVQSTSSVKEGEGSKKENTFVSENSGKEVKPEIDDVSLPDSKPGDAASDCNVSPISERITELNKETLEEKCDRSRIQSCSSETPSPSDVHDSQPHQRVEEFISSHSPTPSEAKGNCDSQEMEIRNRRLRHFISMGSGGGESEENSTTAEDIPPEDKTQIDGESIQNMGADQKKDDDIIDSALSPSEEEEKPPGSVRIRIKFLDETQKLVFAKLTEQVGTFKRQHFSIEMDANRRIRLIFNGQLLSRDSSTLAQYGLFDNCVVHCHVSQPQIVDATGQISDLAGQEEDDAYMSALLVSMLVFFYIPVFHYLNWYKYIMEGILWFLSVLFMEGIYFLEDLCCGIFFSSCIRC